MELPELSLAAPTSCSSSESSGICSSSRKRKALSDSILENKSLQQQAHRNIDLQHSSERLPFDWEQCLDLESGKMYFLNRKTLKRSWDRPTTKDQHHHHQYRQKLNLELNISSPTAAAGVTNKPKPKPASVSTTNNSYSINRPDLKFQITRKNDHHASANYSNYDKTVAMACRNCHMLVIVSKSSPTCPNCKYVHSIPAPGKPATFKPLDTLSLFS